MVGQIFGCAVIESAKLAAEVVGAQRFQVIADFVRQRELHQRQRLAGVPDDVGIGDAGVQISAAVVVVQRDRIIEALGAHPAVSVPCGTAVLQPDPVDHSVADAPVARASARIGAVAQIPAVQFGRNAALYRQIERGQLVVHRHVVPGAKNREDGPRVHGRSRRHGRLPLRPVRHRGGPLIRLRQQRRQQVRVRRGRGRPVHDNIFGVQHRQQRCDSVQFGHRVAARDAAGQMLLVFLPVGVRQHTQNVSGVPHRVIIRAPGRVALAGNAPIPGFRHCVTPISTRAWRSARSA